MSVRVNSQNPLDEKWWKAFAKDLKKDIKQAQRKKTPSYGRISEINCTQEDIGEAKPLKSKKKTKR